MNLNIRKLLFALAFMLSLFTQAFSQNERSGYLLYSTTWDAAMSPIHITGKFTIYDTVTLTIEPGVEVIFQGDQEFVVHGNLIAKGTKTDSIIFTKADTSSSWKGITVETADPANDSTIFEYARMDYVNTRGIFVLNTNKVSIKNCLFTKNSGISVSIYDSEGIISNSTFLNNNVTYTDVTGAMRSTVDCGNSSLKIINNQFINNKALKGGALKLNVGCDADIINNSFVGNNAIGYGGAVFIYAGSSRLNNNIFWNNTINNSQYWGINLHFGSGDHNVTNCAFEGGTSSIDNDGATLTYEGGSFDATCLELSGDNSALTGPNFIDPDNNDYSLGWQSPLINAGDTTGISELIPATDFNGQPRIQRGIIDMGAFESPNIQIELVGLSGENGSITPETKRVAEDSSFSFVIKPEVGYSVDSARFAGSDVLADLVSSGDSLLYTIDEVTQSDTMYVGFAINTYTMRAVAGEHGAVIPDSAVVEYGSEFTYTIRVDEGHQIATASIGGIDVTKTILESDLTYTIDSVIQADTLYVSFELESYAMKSIAGANGTVSPEEQLVTRYDSIVYIITPDANYEVATAVFKSQDVMDKLVETATGFTFKVDSVLEGGLLEISFKEKPGSVVTGQEVSPLKVFPNPATGIIVIEGLGIESISIVNMEGRIVEQVMAAKSKTSIDLSQYPRGIYFVIIKNNKGTETEKIVLE